MELRTHLRDHILRTLRERVQMPFQVLQHLPENENESKSNVVRNNGLPPLRQCGMKPLKWDSLYRLRSGKFKTRRIWLVFLQFITCANWNSPIIAGN